MNIQSAINSKNILSFSYDGYTRIVEPHTFGIDKKNHLAVRGYQVKGGSQSGEFTGWKMFHVNEIQNLSILSEHFLSPRPEYKRNDSGFLTIYAQL